MPKPRAIWPLVLMLLMPLGTAAGQARQRIVDWALKDGARERALAVDSYGQTAHTDLTALEIVGISVAGKPVAPGRPFVADENWVGDLRVRVRNTSPKPIARASLSFDVPEAKYGGGTLAVGLHFGALGPCVHGGEPEVAAPGEEFELSMTKSAYEHSRDWIASVTGLTSIRRLDIRSASLAFDDCTRWAMTLRPANARPASR
jgi:hypothetical protein